VVVLAATFTVLGLLPLVFLADLGFAVAFGVLLDTFIVRVVLVSALAYDIGPTIWWPPSKPAATGQQFPRTGRPPRTRPPADAMTATTPCIHALSARQRPTLANLTRRVPRPAAPDIGRHQRAGTDREADPGRRPRLTRRTTAATHAGSCPAEAPALYVRRRFRHRQWGRRGTGRPAGRCPPAAR